MTNDNDKVEIAKLNERSSNQKDRIEKLENNQRWGVMAILGVVVKGIFDYFSKGS